MAGLAEYLTCIEYSWQYKWLDPCLHNKAFELCISLLNGYKIWTFCLLIRNTLIMHWKELNFLLNLWLCPFKPLSHSQMRSWIILDCQSMGVCEGHRQTIKNCVIIWHHQGTLSNSWKSFFSKIIPDENHPYWFRIPSCINREVQWSQIHI
jgi:hypothetical protein